MIFCIEDDASIRDLMIYTLRTSGFEAEGFNDGEELFARLAAEEGTGNLPELFMIDIMLPGEDGLTILKKLKENPATKDIPVIMETAKGTEFDTVIGLDTGADDYLTKPFGMMEMVARIKAVLRRTSGPQEEIIVNGELEINETSHVVTAAGEPVTLTLKEYELLQTFMQNPGKVFTRDSLLSNIWGIDFAGETRTVDVHIGTLRTKLGRCGDMIKTVRGVGYKMV